MKKTVFLFICLFLASTYVFANSWTDRTDLNTVPSDSDTIIIYDSSAGMVKELACSYLKLAGYQGLQWNATDGYTRTGTISWADEGSSPGDSHLPVQGAMKRCVLEDDGNVAYYLDPTDSTLREGGTEAAVLNGTDGQVMVEVPAFFYSYDHSGNVHAWKISPTPFDGGHLHPAFNKNNSTVDLRYIGAYEASLYDASAGAMVADADIETNMYASGDKLCSISGEYPKTNETRDEFRSAAAERGTGWRQQDYDLVSAIQLLYLIEYADWDSQSMIGMGRTQLSGGSWAAGSYIGETGLSNSDGDGTNAVAYDGDADDAGAENAYMTYRGIENFYGNVWKWVDGININGNVPYVCNNDSNFADDTATDYIDLNITLPASNGYQTTLEQISRGFLPSAVGGSSSTYITDYYYQNPGWRVARLGGCALDGSVAGVASWFLSCGSSDVCAAFAGRLAY